MMNKRLKKIFCYVLILAIVIGNLTAINVSAGELRKPFKDHVIPGVINASDLDSGPMGNAYFPSTANNDTNYRNDVEVGLYNLYGNMIVSMSPGMWLRYTVTVTRDGLYDIYVTDASSLDYKQLEISFLADPVKISGPIPATADWGNLVTHKFGQKYLKAGTYTMQIKMLDGGSNFHSVEFKIASEKSESEYESGAYRQHVLPTVIKAEEFDKGIGGGYSLDGENNGKVFRENDRIDIYENDDGYHISLSEGEYTNYTFNVAYEGVYGLRAVTQSGVADLKVYIDNYEYPVEVSAKDKEEADLFSIYLPKGIHQVRVESGTDAAKLDYIKFTESNDVNPFQLNDFATPIVTEEEIIVTDPDKVFKNLYVSPEGDDNGTGDKSSPFATIERAKEEAGKLAPFMDGNIVINIESGYYKLEETITFNEADSGQNGYNIIYKGMDKENQPVVGSGVKISNWEKTDNGIWKASVPELTQTRRLSINGQAAIRAKSKYIYPIIDEFIYSDSDYVADGLYVEATNFPVLEHPEDAELIFDILWTCQRLPVRDMEKVGDKIKIHVLQPSIGIARAAYFQTIMPNIGQMSSIENAYELLDEPGEFFFDEREKIMYYIPYEEEDMTTAECYAGGDVVELIKVEGTSLKNKASNLVFENIGFKHTSWNEISTTGYLSTQAECRIQDYNSNGNGPVDTYYRPPATVSFYRASNVSVIDCTFENVGTAAVAMWDCVTNGKIIGNLITDSGASGLQIGHWKHDKTTVDTELAKNIEISNNVIHRIADDIRSGTGITVYYAKGVNIHHNDIKDVPYTGITMGWGWATHNIDSSNNIIAYNKIENVTQHQVDGGHIYTLGSLRNSRFHNNYLVGAGDYRGGIYHDSGTAFLEVDHNVITNVNRWWFAYASSQHGQINSHNNYVDTPNYEDDPLEKAVAVDTYIVDGGRWPQEAQTIINNAGVTAEYKGLLEKAEYPEWRDISISRIAKEKFVSKANAWVEAENYNNGPEGEAFHKVNGGDVVVHMQSSTVHVVGTTFPGEWLKYDIEIPEDGIYKLQVKTANAWSLDDIVPKARVYVDDEVIVNAYDIPNTGIWNNHPAFDVGEFFLTAGKHTVKFEFVDNAWSFDAWRFAAMSADNGMNDFDFNEGIIEERTENAFTDIEGHWAKRDINNMKKQGVVGGVGNNKFNPDAQATLYQMCWMAGRYFGLFDATDSDWKEKAAETGLLLSVTEEDKPLTKERMADIVANGYMIFYKIEDYEPRREIEYADFDSISEEYKDSVRFIRDFWLITADENGNFNPKNTVTRAEAVNILSRYDDISGNSNKPTGW